MRTHLAILKLPAPAPSDAGERVASEIFRRLDNRIERLEDELGFADLLRFTDRLGLDHVNGHVDRYRRVVRAGGWPNEKRPTDFPEFLEDFEASCTAYVDVAFMALGHLIHGELPFDAVLELAVASEALRGQFGKQSPSGLDARLAELEEALAGLLAADLGASSDELILATCTPGRDLLAAEAALLEDFLELRTEAPSPPTLEALVKSASPRVRRFLRVHCLWSIARLHQVYDQLDDDLLLRRVEHARRRRLDAEGARHAAVARIEATCSNDVSARILRAAGEVRTLNAINLSIEPSLSFKGGSGLAHGEVFERVAGLPQGLIPGAKIASGKWALLADARNRKRTEE